VRILSLGRQTPEGSCEAAIRCGGAGAASSRATPVAALVSMQTSARDGNYSTQK
jgi:hypothetical protein